MIEEINKLMNSVESLNKQDYAFFTSSEEVKNIVSEYCPDMKVIVLPESHLDKDKLYIIPTDNIRPIKI